jgi:SAM-dependent methyltransferase
VQYHQEPEIIFTSIDSKRYCEFYNLELSTFTKDVSFYKNHINQNHRILELGAGSGRITRHLISFGKTVVALDISLDMLKHQKKSDSLSLVCGDMCDFSLSSLFDTIVIPYNTINLLRADQIETCLSHCKDHMHNNSQLLLEVYTPTIDTKEAGNKSFQFQFLPSRSGGKVIKETLREYNPQSSTLFLEERYRVRPFSDTESNEDLNNFMILHTPTLSQWEEYFSKAGLRIDSTYGGYGFKPYIEDEHSCLFMVVSRKNPS